MQASQTLFNPSNSLFHCRSRGIFGEGLHVKKLQVTGTLQLVLLVLAILFSLLRAKRIAKRCFTLSSLYFQTASRRESSADVPGNQRIPGTTMTTDSLLDFRRIRSKSHHQQRNPLLIYPISTNNSFPFL